LVTDCDDQLRAGIVIAGLDPFYSPSSVVVVGASRQPGKLGHDVLVECARLGFSGSMIGVNPLADGERVAGWPLVRSLDELSEAPDLALVAVPAKRTLDAVVDCARVGVRAAVLAAAGLGELGGEEALLEEEIASAAHKAGMRLLGPNGFGLYVGSIKLNLMGWRDIPAGRIALVTQSGNVAIALCRLMRRSSVGLSSCTGVGNQLDVGFAELLAYHARSVDSDAVALYLEGLRGTPGREFVEALNQCRAEGKPVVVLKSGRSRAGSRSVTTHTGALGGDGRIWDVALREGGAYQVHDPEEMVEALEAHQAIRNRKVRAVLVLSDGGGDTVLASDALEDSGVPLASLTVETQMALDRLVPVAAPRAEGQNPVTLDTAGGMEDDPRLLARCAEVGAADRAVDALVISGTFGGYRARRQQELEVAERLAAIHLAGTPVLVHSAFASDDEETVLELRRAGIPVYRTVRRLAAALGTASAAVRGSRRPSPAQTSKGAALLPTVEVVALLEAAGVMVPPVAAVSNEEELGVATGRMSFPVCLKLEDPAVAHKSDVGGVALHLGANEVAQAAHELWSRFPERQLLVMPMFPRGIELLVGVGFDETFGVYVTVGRGGVTAELDPDVATALAPFETDVAIALWSSLRCAPLLAGWRSSPGADLVALADLAAALSRLGASQPGLELECNPVIAYPHGYAIADVRAVRGGV
jgi:acetate---CoA ligase (ADP-forming)